MPPPTTRRTIPKPRRTLLIFLAFVIGLVGLLVGLDLSAKPGADSVWTPKLGLDLEGGTRITLQAKNDRGNTPDPEKLQEARSIIDQRVNATGVSEAEVSTQGGWRTSYNDAFVWDDDPLGQAGGALDLQSVATHEYGHALGLGHSTAPGSVMSTA